MAPERVLGRQRLGLEDVEVGVPQVSDVERREQVGIDQVPASPEVDHDSSRRQRSEARGIQNPPRLRRQRQQVDDDLAAAEQAREAIGTALERHARARFWRTAPGCDVEADGYELVAHRAPELAEAEHADSPVARETGRQLTPRRRLLLQAVGVVQPMCREHVGERGLAHQRHHPGVDHARDRNLAGHARVVKQRVDSHPERLDQARARVGGEGLRPLGGDQHDIDEGGVGDLVRAQEAVRRTGGAQGGEPSLGGVVRWAERNEQAVGHGAL